jgi:hypothetical protein
MSVDFPVLKFGQPSIHLKSDDPRWRIAVLGNFLKGVDKTCVSWHLALLKLGAQASGYQALLLETLAYFH